MNKIVIRLVAVHSCFIMEKSQAFAKAGPLYEKAIVRINHFYFTYDGFSLFVIFL